MAGNVWDWTSGILLSYTYIADWREESTGYPVLRGGSWFSVARYARAAFRLVHHPGSFVVSGGFRLVRASPSS
jgi:formylglycine-generating enzyme required for sulfatase activity